MADEDGTVKDEAPKAEAPRAKVQTSGGEQLDLFPRDPRDESPPLPVLDEAPPEGAGEDAEAPASGEHPREGAWDYDSRWGRDAAPEKEAKPWVDAIDDAITYAQHEARKLAAVWAVLGEKLSSSAKVARILEILRR